MSKPDDIPQGIWDAGLAVAEPINETTILHDIIAEAAARAIVAERHNACMIVMGASSWASRSEIRDRIMAGDK